MAYPLGIYFGLQHFGIQTLSILMLFIALLHGLNIVRGQKQSWLWLVVCLALAAWSWQQDSSLGLKLYPVFINLGMLLIFYWSLKNPPSAIERLARLKEPDLPASGVSYTRKVTQVWCWFFIGNGTVAAYLAIFASEQAWALYNGLIAYVLMALLFAIEWMIRQRVRANNLL